MIDEIAVNKQIMEGFTVKDVCQIAMNRFWWSKTFTATIPARDGCSGAARLWPLSAA